MHLNLLHYLGSLKERLGNAVDDRRLARLRAAGFTLGADVHFPPSTYVDEEYCHLISIGHSCGFSVQVMLFAHDAALEATTGMVRVGTVQIRHSSHLGVRTIVMPGVEIGPRTVVAGRSVVTRSLPADTFCAGDPARPYATLDQYLEQHRRRVSSSETFPYDRYDIRSLTPERRAELVAATSAKDAYIIGGRTAELRARGGTRRTPGVGSTPESVASSDSGPS